MRRLAIVCLLAGCGTGSHVVSLAEPTRTFSAANYVDLVKRWTRHGHATVDFDIALDVDATLRAPEFRAGYAEQYITVYRIGPELTDQKRAELRGEGADKYEFHVESQTHSYELNELNPAKKIWRVSLLNDQNQEVLPLDVQAIKERAEVTIAFYPYANLFSRAWRLQFPQRLPDGTPLVRPETSSLTLRFAGPQGLVDLIWRLR